MTLDEALTTLRAHQAELRRRGIVHASLFGSVSRGEAGSSSDVDIVVDLDRAIVRSVFDRVGLIHFLQDLLNRPVDLVTRPIAKPHLRDRVERDAVVIF